MTESRIYISTVPDAVERLREFARDHTSEERCLAGDVSLVLAELEHMNTLAHMTRASAEEIALAISAQLKRDAHWAEVDAYYRERAKR